MFTAPVSEMSKFITQREANLCLWYFKKHIDSGAQLVGSFGKGICVSNHDIDIYLPSVIKEGFDVGMRKVKMRNKIEHMLDAKKVEATDWGGYYFHDTPFGDVDTFFDISQFDH